MHFIDISPARRHRGGAEGRGRRDPSRAFTRNSTSARLASKSSTGRSCRRYSDRGKIGDCRNSTSRRRTSSLGNSLESHSRERRGLNASRHNLERCCRAAADNRAGSRSHASDGCASERRAGDGAAARREPARRTRRLARAPGKLPAIREALRRMCATFFQYTRSAFQIRRAVRGPGRRSWGGGATAILSLEPRGGRWVSPMLNPCTRYQARWLSIEDSIVHIPHSAQP